VVPYCDRCGTKLEENARFCQKCGKPVVTFATYVPPPPPPQPTKPMSKDPAIILAVVLVAILVVAIIIVAVFFALNPVNFIPSNQGGNTNQISLNFQWVYRALAGLA
jgi:uncharacterized membrane protein YvbJ